MPVAKFLSILSSGSENGPQAQGNAIAEMAWLAADLSGAYMVVLKPRGGESRDEASAAGHADLDEIAERLIRDLNGVTLHSPDPTFDNARLDILFRAAARTPRLKLAPLPDLASAAFAQRVGVAESEQMAQHLLGRICLHPERALDRAAAMALPFQAIAILSGRTQFEDVVRRCRAAMEAAWQNEHDRLAAIAAGTSFPAKLFR